MLKTFKPTILMQAFDQAKWQEKSKNTMVK